MYGFGDQNHNPRGGYGAPGTPSGLGVGVQPPQTLAMNISAPVNTPNFLNTSFSSVTSGGSATPYSPYSSFPPPYGYYGQQPSPADPNALQSQFFGGSSLMSAPAGYTAPSGYTIAVSNTDSNTGWSDGFSGVTNSAAQQVVPSVIGTAPAAARTSANASVAAGYLSYLNNVGSLVGNAIPSSCNVGGCKPTFRTASIANVSSNSSYNPPMSVTASNNLDPMMAAKSKNFKGKGNVSFLTYPNADRHSIRGFNSATAGGAGAWPRRKFRPTSGEPRLVCETCKVECIGNVTFKEHVEGRKHKGKVARSKEGDQPKTVGSFRCELCDVVCGDQLMYATHLQGVRHQRVLKLTSKMGKEMSNVVSVGEKLISQIPLPGSQVSVTSAGKAVVGVPLSGFVRGETQLSGSSPEGKDGKDRIEMAKCENTINEALLKAGEKSVGEEFVHEECDAEGKFVRYNCKLCNCCFSDIKAKLMHTQGKHHRTLYKEKVNPNLSLETKKKRKSQRREIALSRFKQLRLAGNVYSPFGLLRVPFDWNFESMDYGTRLPTDCDQMVLHKDAQICADKEETESLTKLVASIEMALKMASDRIHYGEKEFGVKETATADSEQSEGDKSGDRERLLKGVMRVGVLSKDLLLKSDTEVKLVVLCSRAPTRALLSKVTELVTVHIQNSEDGVIVVTEKAEECAFEVKQKGAKCAIRAVLTSLTMREPSDPTATNGDLIATKNESEKDALPVEPSLKALAELRHQKWFQVKCLDLQSAVITVRIFREICSRVSPWKHMDSWAMELLVEKVIASCGALLSPGDAVRRVFEAIASGVLFDDGPGILDPCEKGTVDAIGGLTAQQREDITASAQHALRLIEFGGLSRVINIPIADVAGAEDDDQTRPLQMATAYASEVCGQSPIALRDCFIPLMW